MLEVLATFKRAFFMMARECERLEKVLAAKMKGS